MRRLRKGKEVCRSTQKCIIKHSNNDRESKDTAIPNFWSWSRTKASLPKIGLQQKKEPCSNPAIPMNTSGDPESETQCFMLVWRGIIRDAHCHRLVPIGTSGNFISNGCTIVERGCGRLEQFAEGGRWRTPFLLEMTFDLVVPLCTHTEISMPSQYVHY